MDIFTHTVNSEHIRSSNHRICHTTPQQQSLYTSIYIFFLFFAIGLDFDDSFKGKNKNLHSNWLTSEQLNLSQVKIQTTILAASTISTKQRWIWCVQCFWKDVFKLRCRWSSLFILQEDNCMFHIYTTQQSQSVTHHHHAYFYKTKFHRSYESRVKS